MGAPASEMSGILKETCEKIAEIPNYSPRSLYDQLSNMGYVGQEQARRSLCLMAYRHVRRLKDIFLRKIHPDKLPAKTNVLMVGPTGCGKTHLAELLFEKVVKVPVVSVDMTGFSETGYVGRSVSELVSALMEKAKGNLSWAMTGICILDEFDKLAGASSNVTFAGQGTTKDVSGYGVQRELLKMIEGGVYPSQSDRQVPHAAPVPSFFTKLVGFVACGAFSGIMDLASREQGRSSFGFSFARKRDNQAGIPCPRADQEVAVEVLQKFGFLPELIARFTSICHFQPLSIDDLEEIMLRNVLPSFEQEFHREGLKLCLPNKVLRSIIDKAFERQTGARGLSFEMTKYLEDRAFESFGDDHPLMEKECVA